MSHVTLLIQYLVAITQQSSYRVEKVHWHMLRRFKNTGSDQNSIKYLLCTPCATNSKCLTLLQLPLHVVNNTTGPRSNLGSCLSSPVMRRENGLGNSFKAIREKGKLRGSKRQLQAQGLGQKDQLHQPQSYLLL